MPVLADYHVHSRFSADCKIPGENMVKRAIELGLNRICFTEHIDFDYPERYQINFMTDIPAYFRETERLKQIYAGEISVLHGIELGLTPQTADRYRDLVRNIPFDFVICSSHVIDGYDPYYPEIWQLHTEEEVVIKYFQTIIDNVTSFTDFDSYGHIDYIIRYCKTEKLNYSYKKYADIIDSALKTILSAGKIIEVNSSGLRYGLNNPHPHWDILKRYKELGGELLTIGSDSHKPEDIATHFDDIAIKLRSLGFKYYAVFENRKISTFKL